MRSRLRALFQLDNIAPALIILIALIVSFEPKVLGIEIPDRQITLALFALLGINALIERSGLLHRMSGGIEKILLRLDREATAGKALRTRATFERTETLIADTKRSLMIIGINLQAATDALPSIVELARNGTAVRLLAVDPDGASLEHGARMSGVDADIRRQKIRQNLNLIKNHFHSQLSVSAQRRCTLQVVDRILPVGVIGVDTDSRNGWLIVQHYLTETPAERTPLMWLRKNSDPDWFKCYLEQCRACFYDAREW